MLRYKNIEVFLAVGC